MELIKKYKSILLLVAAFLLIVIVAAWAVRHFSTPIFYLDGYGYRKSEVAGNRTLYRSAEAGKTVEVIDEADYKAVRIDSRTYKIRQSSAPEQELLFHVEDPDGNTVEGKWDNGMFFVREPGGGFEPEFPEMIMEVGGKRVVPDREEGYRAGKLVEIAYEPLQRRNGRPWLFLLGGLGVLLGWCALKYPMFFFKLRYSLWVQAPEPSDFYMFMAKAGAILAIVAGFCFIYESLGIIY